jgi:hypothetical protein
LSAAFIVNSRELLEKMRSALDATDYDSIGRAAQSYIDAAAVFELSGAVETAAMLDRAAQQTDASTAAALIVTLEAQTKQALATVPALVRAAA